MMGATSHPQGALMSFAREGTPRSRRAVANAKQAPFWLDTDRRPQPAETLVGSTDTDLLVVGSGFTGLWTALLAKQQEPRRDVVVVDAHCAATGATGRNGGFVAASLTHGLPNGLARWPDELAAITRMGIENLDAIAATIAEHQIDCDFERTGELAVATSPHQVDELRDLAAAAAPFGEQLEFLDADAVRNLANSPTYQGGLYDPHGVALVDPARLAWGLRDVCQTLGVRFFDNTEVTELGRRGNAMVATTPYGQLNARKVALATNAYPSLLRRVRQYIVPVYDYVLMSEPLSPEQQASIGWDGRQGIGDSGNQFHYYRRTADNRILWGGYDAAYYWGSGFGSSYEHSPEAWARIAEHFFQTFPQLEGLTFTHKWAGAIDTCTRFCAFWGTAHRGMTAYVAGFTGLGVGASRFAALTMLDQLDGRDTERTRLRMVQTKPMPWPPEPIRAAGIGITRWSLDRADRNAGQRNVWLRTLDRLGLGFDS